MLGHDAAGRALPRAFDGTADSFLLVLNASGSCTSLTLLRHIPPHITCSQLKGMVGGDPIYMRLRWVGRDGSSQGVGRGVFDGELDLEVGSLVWVQHFF